MPKAAPPLEIPPRDKRRLRAWTQSRNIPAGLAQRARIVLLAGHGLANAEIAERTGVSRPTVILWRNRYAEGGLGAPGRPAPVRAAEADRPAGDRDQDAGTAASQARGDALVIPAAGRRDGHLQRDRGHRLAGL